jgi:hypothetical protein
VEADAPVLEYPSVGFDASATPTQSSDRTRNDESPRLYHVVSKNSILLKAE